MNQNNENTTCDMFFNFDKGNACSIMTSERQILEHHRSFKFDTLAEENVDKYTRQERINQILKNIDYISQSNTGSSSATVDYPLKLPNKHSDYSDDSSSPGSISCFNSKRYFVF